MSNIVGIRHKVIGCSVKGWRNSIVLGVYHVLDNTLGAFVIISGAEMFELQMTEVAGVGRLPCMDSHMCCQLCSLTKLSATLSALKAVDLIPLSLINTSISRPRLHI